MFDLLNFKKFDSPRKFGVELEASGLIKKKKVADFIRKVSNMPVLVSKYNLSVNNDYWHIKDDATCGDFEEKNGVEVASFIAKGCKDLQHISNITDLLYSIGCRTNFFCGLHIHADASDLSIKHVGTLIAYWLKIENILAASLPFRRRCNEFCVPLGLYRKGLAKSGLFRIAWKPEDLWTIYSPSNTDYYQNNDRRVNFNLVNYARSLKYDKLNNVRKTLELRWPEGSLSGIDVRCWVRLFLGFIDNCKNKKMPSDLLLSDLEETMELLGFSHNGNSFNILSEGLYETKVWFLERIIKYSPKSHHALQAKEILQKIK